MEFGEPKAEWNKIRLDLGRGELTQDLEGHIKESGLYFVLIPSLMN